MKLLPDAVRKKYPVRFFDKGGATERYLDGVPTYTGTMAGLREWIADTSKRAEIRRFDDYVGFAKRQQARIEGNQTGATWPPWVFIPRTKSLFSPASTDMLKTLMEVTFEEVRALQPE